MELSIAAQHSPSLTSKASIKELAGKVQQEVAEGRINAVTLALQLKAMEEFIGEIRALIEPDVTDGLMAYERGTFLRDGSKVEIAEVGVKYDYSQTEVWRTLKAKEDAVAESRKSLEAQLKTLKVSQMVVDDISGEVITLVPPVKTSKTSYKATLSK